MPIGQLKFGFSASDSIFFWFTGYASENQSTGQYMHFSVYWFESLDKWQGLPEMMTEMHPCPLYFSRPFNICLSFTFSLNLCYIWVFLHTSDPLKMRSLVFYHFLSSFLSENFCSILLFFDTYIVWVVGTFVFSSITDKPTALFFLKYKTKQIYREKERQTDQ